MCKKNFNQLKALKAYPTSSDMVTRLSNNNIKLTVVTPCSTGFSLPCRSLGRQCNRESRGNLITCSVINR